MQRWERRARRWQVRVEQRRLRRRTRGEAATDAPSIDPTDMADREGPLPNAAFANANEPQLDECAATAGA